jgi:hypothetical protein
VKKIAAILSLNTLIIFLSDIRLNTDAVGGNENLFSPSYNFLYNSTANRRGVGLLLSTKLQYTVLKEYSDKNNNIFGLKVLINNVHVLLISVYGPNIDNKCSFFQDLNNILAENVGCFTILGGDWNLTYSTDHSTDNIDIVTSPALYYI